MSKARKTDTKTVEEVVVEPVAETAEVPQKYFRIGKVFWGFTFIFIGTLLLLDNIGIINVHFMRLWQLWPVLIIGAGISMLSLRGWLAALASTLLIVTLGALTFVVAVENPFYTPTQSSHAKTLTIGDATSATDKGLDVTLKTGAITLVLSSSSAQREFSSELMSDDLTLNRDGSIVRDGVRYVMLATDTKNGWLLGPINSEMRLSLNQSLPLALRIETGATSLSGDLSATQLKTLTIKAGASTIDLKLGTNQVTQDVTLECGASNITLRIPKSAGVRIDSESGLTHTSFAGVEKLANGVYESADFSATDKRVIIHAKLGVSSFSVERY